MKKISFILISLFLLTSCFSESGLISPENNNGLLNYSSEEFSIQTPETWVDLTWNNEILPSIESAEISLAKSSPENVSGYANNIIILSHTLKTSKSSLDYALLNSLQAGWKYKDYSQLKSESFVFEDGDKSSITVFEWRYNSQTPKYKFIQTWKVCKNNRAFFLTIGVNLNITDTARYEEILKTFKCKG